jgi:hypothetical protein
MPTLRPFANCKISIYADDHMPPHFHIEGRGFRAVVEIETMVVRAGDVRRAPEAPRWARDNVVLLRAEWRRLNQRA